MPDLTDVATLGALQRSFVRQLELGFDVDPEHLAQLASAWDSVSISIVFFELPPAALDPVHTIEVEHE